MKLRRDVCYGCGSALTGGAQSYRLRIELFASPEVPDLSTPAAAGIEPDLREQWDALVKELSAMNEQEVEEATDEVYERYEFVLCTRCRREWHTRLNDLSRRTESLTHGSAPAAKKPHPFSPAAAPPQAPAPEAAAAPPTDPGAATASPTTAPAPAPAPESRTAGGSRRRLYPFANPSSEESAE